ncbi:hypothetical protein ACFYXQ_33725 [Nocardia jiangxiensis]|uniref:Uncharacterized protein n=1 Tax=Nocardia jiangxiensis TaxID=282685 RepID=A0ABW6S8Y9_9NOCA
MPEPASQASASRTLARHGRRVALAGAAGRITGFARSVALATVLGTAALTLAAIAGAPLIVRIFVADSGERHLTTLFAYLLLPEIFCYGLAALLTAVLNVAHLLMAVVGASAGAAVFLLAVTVIGIPEVRRARSLLSV